MFCLIAGTALMISVTVSCTCGSCDYFTHSCDLNVERWAIVFIITMFCDSLTHPGPAFSLWTATADPIGIKLCSVGVSL